MKLSLQHCSGPLPHGYESFCQFRQYKSKDLIVTCFPGDYCVHIDGFTCVIKNILFSKSGLVKIVYSKFLKSKSFSSYPFDLKLININEVTDLSSELYVEKLSKIEFKCVLLPYPVKQNYFVSMPLLHNV